MSKPSPKAIKKELRATKEKFNNLIDDLYDSVRDDQEEGSTWRLRHLEMIKRTRKEIVADLNNIGNAIRNEQAL
jgi:hypothetical protein